MIRIATFVLMAMALLATPLFAAEHSTDAQRIELLEKQLAEQRAMMEQQQKMLESMSDELRALKDSQNAVAPATPGEPSRDEDQLTADEKAILAAAGKK